jgi:hypothetical protein
MLGQNIGRVGLPDISAGGRPSLTLDFVSIPVLNEKITFSRTSGATWFSPDGVLEGVDFSTTSVAIGTGSKTFTLAATAGANRYWAVGDLVRVSQQSNSANFMEGTVTSYTASTQVLVIDVTSTGGSGTIASWRVSSHMPRFDYNPSTLAAQGLLIEEARTNSIRNNTMVGAVAGTPGTFPQVSGSPTWSIAGGGLGTLTQQIVGVSTSNGITYIDIKFSGTTSTTNFNVSFETATQIAALSGQTWTESAYAAIVGGATTNITNIRLQLEGRNSGGTTVESFLSAGIQGSLTSALQRFTLTSTFADATTAFARPTVRFDFASGVAIDITLRIGPPQLEQGAFATSVIPTTTTALTRSADVASVNTLSPWYSATEGTLYFEAQFYNAPNVAGSNMGALSDGTNSNRISVSSATTFSGNINSNVTSGGSPQANPYVGSLSTVGPHKAAATYSNNSFNIAVNGTLGIEDTSGIVPVSVNTLILGRAANGAGATNGWLRRTTYYPRKLSSAELQAITT